MSKIRKSILIIGILVIVIAASLATALALLATGSIKTDPIELEFKLKEQEKIYDGTPLKLSSVDFDEPSNSDIELTKGELLAGHAISVDFIGSQTNVGTSMSDATVKIYDSNGFNVTADYIVKVIPAELTVHKKTISVDMPSQKVVYNGSKVLFNDYNVTDGDLCSGHKIYGSTEAGLMNVGDTLPEDLAPLVFDVAGNDVTENYEIADFTYDGIEVIKRPLSVRPISYEKVYDGTPLTVEGVEYLNDTSLVEGQYARFEINDGYLNAIDVITTETRISEFRIYEVINGEETEVTSNYDVESFEVGSLTVKPRPLTVRGKSASFVYDGTEHSLESENRPEEAEGLVEGETVTSVIYNASITNVGTVDNVISDIIISSNADNYTLSVIYGKLEVTPFAVTVKTGSAERYYNGNALTNNELSFALANDNHTIERVEDDLPSITDAGEKQNAYTCRFLDGSGADVTVNYDITYDFGTLKVNKLPVAVTLNDLEKVEYNGAERTPDIANPEYFSIEAAVDAEEAAQADTDTEEGEEGEEPVQAYRLPAPSDFAVVSAKKMSDSGEYPYTVRFGDRRLYDNYILDVVKEGYFTITPKKIAVTTTTRSKTYDGTPLYDIVPSYDAENAFVLDHKFAEIKEYPSITDKGVIENKYALTVETADGVNVSPNYEIIYNYGTLEIESYNLSVTLENITENYSGKKVQPEPAEALKNLNETLISAEDFTVTVDGEAINASATPYYYGVKITDKKFAENFNLTVTNANGKGSITINPLPVTLTVRDVTQVYNGADQPLDSYAAVSGIGDTSTGLTRDDFKVKYTGTHSNRNAGEFAFTVEFAKAEVGKNYTLTVVNAADSAVENATLYRKPFSVTVTTASGSFVYDGNEHSLSDYTNTVLASDKHTLSVTNSDNLPKVKNVEATAKENRLEFEVLDGGNSNQKVTGNYDIKCNYGKLTVTPRPITVTTGSASRAYDGTPLRCETLGANYTLFGDHRLMRYDDDVYNPYPEQTEVGTATNAYRCVITSDSEGDVNSNYLITYVYGTLTVTGRSITVHTATVSWVYDGVEHSDDSTVASNLPAGFAIVRKPAATGEEAKTVKITDVGSVLNVYEYVIVIDNEGGEDNGKDVTEFFTINYDYGTLSVTPRTLDLSLVSFEEGTAKKYNGGEQTLTVAEALGNAGDQLGGLLTVNDFEVVTSAPLVDAGKYTYTLKFVSNEKAKNFSFISPVASVRINKLTVSLQFTDELSFVFDNKVKNISAAGIIEGIYDSDTLSGTDLLSASDFTVEVVSDTDRNVREVLNVGAYTYTVKIADRSLLQNFAYNELNHTGTATVTPAKATVTLKNYDDITYSGKPYQISASDAISVGSPLLKASDFRIKVGDGTIEIVDAGTYGYSAEPIDNDYLANFDVTYVEGSVTVKPLRVRATVKDYSFVFKNVDRRGEINAASSVNLDTSLLPANAFTLSFSSDGVNYADDEALQYAGTYYYKAALDESVLEASDVKAKNFTITYGEGRIEIAKLDVTVTLANVSKEYDGRSYDIVGNASSLVAGVSSEVISRESFNLRYASANGNEVYGVHYYTAQSKVVDANFNNSINLTVIDGSVSISKRAVTVYTGSAPHVYDGAEFKDTSAPELLGGVAGHRAEAKGTLPSITDVGKVQNKYECVIKNGADEVTNNYSITYVYGTLEVTPRPVTVTTGTPDSRAYDGNAFSDPTATVSGGIAGHSAKALGTVPSITDAGKAENRFLCKIEDATGRDVSSNYQISYVYGTLEITKAVATVSYKTGLIAQYDGTEHTYTAEQVIDSVTAAGGLTADKLEFVCNGQIKNAGTYSFTVRLSDEAAKNYSLQSAYGTVTVNKAELNVNMSAVNADYNGAAQVIGNECLTVGSNYDNLVSKDFEFVYNRAMIDAQDYAAAGNFTIKFINSAHESNYDLKFTGATFTVNKLKVTVTTNDITRIYDGKTQAITAAEAIASVDTNLLRVNDFVVTTTAKTAGEDLTYTVTLVNDKNFELGGATGSVTGKITIEKRKITLNFSPVTVTRAELNAGGNQCLVNSYLTVSNLAEGDSFSVTNAWAEYADGMLHLISGDFEYSLSNSDCYEIVNYNANTAYENNTASVTIIG